MRGLLLPFRPPGVPGKIAAQRPEVMPTPVMLPYSPDVWPRREYRVWHGTRMGRSRWSASGLAHGRPRLWRSSRAAVCVGRVSPIAGCVEVSRPRKIALAPLVGTAYKISASYKAKQSDVRWANAAEFRKETSEQG